MQLYAEKKIEVAMEAGQRAINLGLARTFDVHFRDAVAKVVLELNAIVSPHEDEIDIKGDLPVAQTLDDAVAMFQTNYNECEAALPKGGDVDEASISLQTMLLLYQLYKVARQLYSLWK